METIKYIKLEDVESLEGRDLAKNTILELIKNKHLPVYSMEDKTK